MRLSRLVLILAFTCSGILVWGTARTWLRCSPLPPYQMEVEGGRAASLGPRPLLTLDAESPLSIVLRPQVAVTHPVFVSALVQEQAQQLLWPVLFESTAHGTQRLQGIVRELRLPCRRRCTLTLYVSDFMMPPALLWIVSGAASARYLPHTQVLQTDILIEPPPAASPPG